MGELIEYFGGQTYVLMLITMLLGITKWKLKAVWIRPGYHYFMAVLTFISATTHLILVALH